MKSRRRYSPSHYLLFIARRLKNVQLYERRDRSTLADTDRRASDVPGPGTAVAANQRRKEAVCHKTFNEAVRRSRTVHQNPRPTRLRVAQRRAPRSQRIAAKARSRDELRERPRASRQDRVEQREPSNDVVPLILARVGHRLAHERISRHVDHGVAPEVMQPAHENGMTK
jgi:hypothetical protein